MSLPSGYRRVEYIRSSGTQYIDTGFAPNQNSRIVVDLDLLTQNTAYTGLFGCRTSSNSGFLVFARTGSPAYQSDFGTEQLYSDGTAYGRHIIDKNKLQFYVDSVLKSSHASATLSVGYNAYLFAINKAGAAMSGYLCTAKLYSCQIYDNSILVRDFIPCKNESGTIGLWDDVNGVFYANAGTGVFTAGPELSNIVHFANLIPNSSFEADSDWSGVSYSTAQAYNGARSGYFGVETRITTCPMPVPIVGHKYYGRHYLKTNGTSSPADCRFEWFAGDGAGLNFVFGWNNGTWPEWNMKSSVIEVTVVNATSYVCRNFVVNNTAELWCDGLMIVDLTASFGAGNEPDQAWCDANIPYFDGTYDLELAPDAPASFYQVLCVKLKWSAVECNGYRLYRDGVLIADTTDTTYLDNDVESGETYEYSIIAYGNTKESSPVTLSVTVREGFAVIRPVVQSAFFQ